MVSCVNMLIDLTLAIIIYIMLLCIVPVIN